MKAYFVITTPVECGSIIDTVNKFLLESLLKQLVLGITHAVKINTAVSTGSTYCPPPSSVSLLRSWSEILGCKVGPYFVANAYEFIHDQNTRASIDFRYAGVSTGLLRVWLQARGGWTRLRGYIIIT